MKNAKIARVKKSKARKIAERTALLFVLPAVLYHMCFITIPAMTTIFRAFYRWDGLSKATYIGLANFREIFTEDTVFVSALANNFKWLTFFLFVPTIIGLLMAMLVTSQKKGQLVYRAMYFMPYVIASVVAGKIWAALFSPYFGINKTFKMLGFDELSKVFWLGDTRIALFSVAFVDNWHYWGFLMVLFIAALHQVDESLYEAVRVEGASKWQEFWYVTIPGIAPTLVFAVMTTMMWSFTTFDYIWTMTKGGPGQATEILSTWIYKNAFLSYRSGYASALCVIQLGFVGIVFFLQKKLRKVAEGYQQ